MPAAVALYKPSAERYVETTVCTDSHRLSRLPILDLANPCKHWGFGRLERRRPPLGGSPPVCLFCLRPVGYMERSWLIHETRQPRRPLSRPRPRARWPPLNPSPARLRPPRAPIPTPPKRGLPGRLARQAKPARCAVGVLLLRGAKRGRRWLYVGVLAGRP